MDRHKSTRKSRSQTSQGDGLQPSSDGAAGLISIEQLQRLVHLLDQSDVSELELRRLEEGTSLVLRKMKLPEGSPGQPALPVGAQFIAPNNSPINPMHPEQARPAETKHYITAHLVGIFHTWARPRGGTLVAVGDHVKVGQLVATIESLNIINEVESPVAGRVAEILVQEGQPVEYGQHLMIIEGTEEEGEEDNDAVF